MNLNKLQAALSEFIGCVLIYGAIYFVLWAVGVSQPYLRDSLLLAWGMTVAQVLAAWKDAR